MVVQVDIAVLQPHRMVQPPGDVNELVAQRFQQMQTPAKVVPEGVEAKLAVAAGVDDRHLQRVRVQVGRLAVKQHGVHAVESFHAHLRADVFMQAPTRWRIRRNRRFGVGSSGAGHQPRIGNRRCLANRSSAVCITERTYSSTSAMSGSFPNCAVMSIGSRTSVTTFDGSGTFGGEITLRPNGKPKLTGRMSIRALVRPSLRANQLPRVKNSWVSCPPIETVGTIGTPASMAVRT